MNQKVLDYSKDPDVDQEGDAGRIRLRSGIDIESLRGPGGVIFEPEIDESFFEANAEDKTYFSNLTEDNFDDLMAKVDLDRVDDGSDDDENLTEFENKLRKMKPIEVEEISEDGKQKKLVTVEGVQKRVLKRGLDTTGLPPPKSTVTVHYSLYIEGQDEPYDSTTLRSCAERFLLDDGRLLVGIELAIKSMRKQEKSEFIIQPEYAFGKMGCPPRIPKDSQILAVIELMSVVQEAEAEALLSMGASERSKKRTFAEILKAAKIENSEGTQYVREKEFAMAAERYKRGIRLLEDVEMNSEEEEMEKKKLIKNLYLNRGHCNLLLHRPKIVCTDMRKVLDIDNRNPKAYYRLGKAKVLLGHKEEALNYYRRAQKILPNDADIGQEILRLQSDMERARRDEIELCKKMMPNAQVQKKPEREEELSFDVDDDFYSDMFSQFEAFKKNNDTDPLYLPTSFSPSEINFTRQIAKDLGLKMTQRTRNSIKQWMVTK